MDQMIAQAIGPDSSLLGRIIAIASLAAVAIFVFMARSSLDARENNAREDREAERRAEAIVAQVRRERAGKN